jgi:hypothetical protein
MACCTDREINVQKLIVHVKCVPGLFIYCYYFFLQDLQLDKNGMTIIYAH